MRRFGICLALTLVFGLGLMTITSIGCGGGGTGSNPTGMPVLSGPITWCDTDNDGVVSATDTFKLCFSTLVAIGANAPDADLMDAPATLAGTDTWTLGPGNQKLTLTLVGGTLTLGKVGGSTLMMAGGNTITNPVDGMTASTVEGPFSITSRLTAQGQFIGGASLSILLVDLDAIDGDLDIVVGAAGANTAFTNSGVNTGTFTAGPVLGGESPGTGLAGGTASSTNGLAAGIINTADVRPDIVALNGFPDLPLGSAKNRVYINTTGTPATTNTDNRSLLGFPANDSIGGVVANQPGWDTVAVGSSGGDLFVANRAGPNMVYFSDTLGVFDGDATLGGVNDPIAVAPAAPSTGDTRAVVGGDIDGDGDMDVIVADDMGAAPGVISVYVVNGGGGLAANVWPPAFVPVSPAGELRNPRALALCDVDNDGDLDLIVGYSTSTGGPGGCQTYSNNGAGVFTLMGAGFGTGDNVLSLSCTHIDGDVLRDVVVGRGSNQGLQVYLNCAAFAFASASYSFPGNVNGVAATPTAPVTGVDPLPSTGFNGNGVGDIVTANASGNNQLYFSGK